ncbi:MAG: CHASE2 domain-containing protein, partial [Deltaproteobacteria bacterium]|nr:CHASE2 domain-containing protein [Deltaproteobacteria bacterium]
MKKFFKSLFSLNPVSITTFCVILGLVLFLIGIPIFDMVELKTYDLRFISRGTLKPSPDVVLAVIDEKSLDIEGRWPWPRHRIARLIDQLSKDGAKVIGFDIGFLEPDQNTNLGFINRFGRQVEKLQIQHSDLKKFIYQSKIEADNDLTLSRAIENSKAPVVLGYFFHMKKDELDYEVDEKDIQDQLGRVSNSRYPLVRYDQDAADIKPFIPAFVPEGNIDLISKVTDGSGYFNMLPDQDGVVRWMPLVIKCGQEKYTPLSIQTVWHYLDRPQLMLEVAAYGVKGIRMGKRFIPTDENGQMLINYLGPARTFPHYSIGDILREALPQGTFKDKIVLVGATAIGIYDV